MVLGRSRGEAMTWFRHDLTDASLIVADAGGRFAEESGGGASQPAAAGMKLVGALEFDVGQRDGRAAATALGEATSDQPLARSAIGTAIDAAGAKRNACPGAAGGRARPLDCLKKPVKT